MYKTTAIVCATLVATVLTSICATRAAAADAADPQRFSQVKQWSGALDTGAQSSGKVTVPGDGVAVYNSAVRVEGRFKLEPFVDKRNGPDAVWRGKGEARVNVSGKRKTTYKEETVAETWVGNYVDTFDVEVSNIDYAKGTYQLAVIRHLWQDQPHKGKAIEQTTVISNAYGVRTTTEMVNGHSWADDAGAGFGRESPMPKQGLIIDGSMTSKNDDFLSRDGSRWTTTWQLRPIDPNLQEPLKAVAGGPYVVERGRVVNLDGWKSTGKIRSYKWKFEPVDAGGASSSSPSSQPSSPSPTIPFNAGAAKEGKRVPVVILAAVKATLTVSDGQKEDSDTVIVKVSARDFQTPFVRRSDEKLHPESIPPRRIKGRDLRYAGGENVCAFENYGDKDTVHVLHPAAKAGSWKGNGYELKKVEDAGGPFDGDWYVSAYTLRVERQTLINKYLLPDGPPPVRTAEPFYKSNKTLGNDVDGYLAAVRKHEMLHSELMQKALKTADAGPKIESLAAKDEASIKTAADKAIQNSEDTAEKASADPLPPVGFKG